MNANNSIVVGIFEGFSWIRSEGKGSFMNSPAMKAFGDSRIEDGETCVVVDLGGCTGMDSTFMGTLAGMAARVSSNGGGVLQVADVSDRNRRSLEDLGLDFLMEIDPPETLWRDHLDEIRGVLQTPPPAERIGDLERTKLVLEAHKKLADVNQENAKTFKNVVSLMEKEVEAKEAKQDQSSES